MRVTVGVAETETRRAGGTAPVAQVRTMCENKGRKWTLEKGEKKGCQRHATRARAIRGIIMGMEPDPPVNCTSNPLPPECPQCRLLSGAFSFLVQGCLAATCLLVLLIKRWREKPKRPFVVWLCDLSKQVFSSTLQHFANLIFGYILSSGGLASECAWYFVLYVITSTAAIAVVALFMAGINYLVRRYDITLLRTGEYGSPPSWRPWLAQLLVWGAVGVSEKVCTTFTLIAPFSRPLGELAHWLEQPLRAHPELELVLVMLLAPVLLNIVSVIIFDQIMKRKRKRGDGDGGVHAFEPHPNCAAHGAAAAPHVTRVNTRGHARGALDLDYPLLASHCSASTGREGGGKSHL
jgi:hypothetical protein